MTFEEKLDEIVSDYLYSDQTMDELKAEVLKAHNENDRRARILAERMKVVENMYRYGGNFICRLGSALSCADGDNAIKIHDAFESMWNRYLSASKPPPTKGGKSIG